MSIPVPLAPLQPLLYEDLVRAALREDLGRAGDLTSDAIIPDGWPAHHDVRDAIVAGDGAMAARVLRGHLDDVTRAVRRHPTVWRDDLLAAG